MVFTFLTRNAKICKNIPILMATRPLFQEFSDGKMSSILSPGMAKIFVEKPVVAKMFVAKTTGVNDMVVVMMMLHLPRSVPLVPLSIGAALRDISFQFYI